MSRASRRRGHSESWRKAENVTGAHERSLPPPTKRTFLLLEAHRPASAVALTPKGWRRARRYENLLLAAAVTKLQRDCLALTEESEWLGRGGRRTLLQGVWLTPPPSGTRVGRGGPQAVSSGASPSGGSGARSLRVDLPGGFRSSFAAPAS